jgi:enoyl-CoA hydratase/carnithine racemase
VPGAELHDAASWAAEAIASAPPLAIQGTLRAIWMGLEQTRTQALTEAYAYIAMGTNQDSIAEGQKAFSSGKRIEWRLR